MLSMTAQHVLRIDSSARYTDSVSRRLTGRLTEQLVRAGAQVVERDLGGGVPVVDEMAVGAYFTPPDQRTAAQVDSLTRSDELVSELLSADLLVLGVPMYNFTVPAALKAYFDLVARAGVTFEYTATGPVGLLTSTRAIVVVTTGGVEVGSAVDFATGYIRQFLGFLGISDIEVVAADLLLADPERASMAEQRLDALAAA
jgi:FMN-dependent NADH-azoreductase